MMEISSLSSVSDMFVSVFFFSFKLLELFLYAVYAAVVANVACVFIDFL